MQTGLWNLQHSAGGCEHVTQLCYEMEKYSQLTLTRIVCHKELCSLYRKVYNKIAIGRKGRKGMRQDKTGCNSQTL